MTNNDQREHFDEWIDQALSAYSAVEPLHGIEERVSRRIAGDGNRRTNPWPGWLRFAVPAAAVLAIGFVAAEVWQPLMPQRTNTVKRLEREAAAAAPPASSSPRLREQLAPRRRIVAVVPGARRISTHAKTLPRKEVFPTPTP